MANFNFQFPAAQNIIRDNLIASFVQGTYRNINCNPSSPLKFHPAVASRPGPKIFQQITRITPKTITHKNKAILKNYAGIIGPIFSDKEILRGTIRTFFSLEDVRADKWW